MKTREVAPCSWSRWCTSRGVESTLPAQVQIKNKGPYVCTGSTRAQRSETLPLVAKFCNPRSGKKCGQLHKSYFFPAKNWQPAAHMPVLPHAATDDQLHTCQSFPNATSGSQPDTNPNPSSRNKPVISCTSLVHPHPRTAGQLHKSQSFLLQQL